MSLYASPPEATLLVGSETSKPTVDDAAIMADLEFEQSLYENISSSIQSFISSSIISQLSSFTGLKVYQILILVAFALYSIILTGYTLIGFSLVGVFGPDISEFTKLTLTVMSAFLLVWYVNYQIEKRRDSFIRNQASLLSHKLMRNIKKPSEHKKFFAKLASTVSDAYSDVAKFMSKAAPDAIDVASFLASNPDQFEKLMRTYNVRKTLILIAGFVAMSGRQRACALMLLITELSLDPRTLDFLQHNINFVADGIFTAASITGLTGRSTDNPEILQEANEIRQEAMVNHSSPNSSDEFNLAAALSHGTPESTGFAHFLESSPHIARLAAIALLFLFHMSGITDKVTNGLFTDCVNSTAQLAKMFTSGNIVYSQLGNTADVFLGGVYSMFGAKYETPAIASMNKFNDRVNALWARVRAIKDAVKSDPLGAMREDRPAKFKAVIETLQHDVKAFDEYQCNVYKFKNRLDEIYNTINELAEIRRSLLSGIGGKQSPVVVYFAGLKNSGKTHMFNRFNEDLQHKTGLSLYSRTAHDKYWSNYQGQGIVAMDDFGQDKEDEDHRTVLKYGSEGAQDVVDAAIQNKGKPFVSQYMTLTSNFTWIRKSQTMNVVDALNRRRDYTIYVHNAAHLAWVQKNKIPHADSEWWSKNPSKLYLVSSEFEGSEENPITGPIESHPSVIEEITYDQLLELAMAKERYYRANYIDTIAIAATRVEGLTVPPKPSKCSYSDTLSPAQKRASTYQAVVPMIEKPIILDSTSSQGDPPVKPFVAKQTEKKSISIREVMSTPIKISDEYDDADCLDLESEDEWSDVSDEILFKKSTIGKAAETIKKHPLPIPRPKIYDVYVQQLEDRKAIYQDWNSIPRFSDCLYNTLAVHGHGEAFKLYMLSDEILHSNFVINGMLSIDAATAYLTTITDKNWAVVYADGEFVYVHSDIKSMTDGTITYTHKSKKFTAISYPPGTKIVFLGGKHFVPQLIRQKESEVTVSHSAEVLVDHALLPYPNSPATIKKSFPILVMGPSGVGKTAAFETSGIPVVNQCKYQYTYSPYPDIRALHDIVILDDITLDSNRWDEARTIMHLYHEGKLPAVTAVYATGNTTSKFYKSLETMPDEKNLFLRRCKVVEILTTRKAKLRMLFTPLHKLLEGLSVREKDQYLMYEIPEGGIGELPWAKRPMSTFANFLRMALYEQKNDCIEVHESIEHTFAMPMPSNFDYMCQLPFPLADEARQKKLGNLTAQDLLPYIIKNIKVQDKNGNPVNGAGMLLSNRYLFRILSESYARAHTPSEFVNQFNTERFVIDYNVALLIRFDDCLVGFVTQQGRVYAFIVDDKLTGWKITDSGVKTPSQFFPLTEENRIYHQILAKMANDAGEFNHVATIKDHNKVKELMWSQTPTYQAYSKYAHYFGFIVTIIAALGMFWPVSDSTGSDQTVPEFDYDEAVDTSNIDSMIEDLQKVRKELDSDPEKGKRRYNGLKDKWKKAGILYDWRTGKNFRKQAKPESSPYYPNTEVRVKRAEYEPSGDQDTPSNVRVDDAYRTQEQLDIAREREEELRERREQEEEDMRRDWEEREKDLRKKGRLIWSDFDDEAFGAKYVEDENEAAIPTGAIMFHSIKGFGIKGDLKIHYVKKNTMTRDSHTVCVDDFEGWRQITLGTTPVMLTTGSRTIKWTPIPIGIQWPLISKMSGKFFRCQSDANTLFITTMVYGVPVDLIARSYIPSFNHTIEVCIQQRLPEILISKSRDMHAPFVSSYEETFQNEGTMDPQSLTATQTMHHNMVEVLDTAGNVLCNGIGLSGSKLMTVYHIHEKVAFVRRIGSNIQYSVMFVKGYKPFDIAVFSVVGSRITFRDITSKFISNDDFTRLVSHNNRPMGYFSVYSNGRDGTIMVTNQMIEFAFNMELKAGSDGNYYQQTNSCQANGVSRPGDCGNPVFLIDKSQQRKIMGMHKKGNERRSVSVIITEEFVRNIVQCEEFVLESAITFEAADLFGQDGVGNRNIRYNSQLGHFNKGMPYVGKVFPKIRIPDKTRKYRSGFVSPQGDKHEPTIMSTEDPRNPSKRDFLREQVGKYTGGELDESLRPKIKEAFKQISNELIGIFTTCGLETETLSTTQLINGDRYKYQFMKPIDRSGSVGFGYTELGYGTTKGDFLIQKDEIWRFADHAGAQKVASDMAVILEYARHGKKLDCPYIAYAKDEVVGLSKIYGEKAKTRSFYAGDMAFQLSFRKMFQSFYARMSECLAYHPIKIGISANGGGWEDLYYSLAKVSDRGWCADAKNWDSHMPEMFMHECCNSINDVYAATNPEHQGTDNMCRSTLHKNVESALVILGGDVIHFEHGGQISGFPGTAPENSLIHWALSYLVYQDLAREHGLPHLATFAKYKELVGCAFYGDDSINTVHPSAQSFFTLPNFIRVAAKYGFEFTPSDKGDVVNQEFQKLTDMDFLKRGFKRYNGQVIGPIAINSIAKHAEWIRGNTAYYPSIDEETGEIVFKTSYEKATIAESISTIWPELALHGPVVYDIWKKSFIQQEKQLKMGIKIPLYQDALVMGGAYL